LTFSGAEFARIQPDRSHVAIWRPAPHITEILSTNRGTATKFCEDCQVTDWSADGSKLLVQRPKALFVDDRATGRERALASHPDWNLFNGRFSPDGRWVVFQTQIQQRCDRFMPYLRGNPLPSPSVAGSPLSQISESNRVGQRTAVASITSPFETDSSADGCNRLIQRRRSRSASLVWSGNSMSPGCGRPQRRSSRTTCGAIICTSH
jgi:hypothetical protein